MDTAKELLQKYWGHTAFRPLQQEIIGSVLAGNDTLAILATGGGKSLCYQLPALRLGGLTLVISPLIALMKDQVDDLNRRGIPAAAWNSSLDSRDRARIEGSLRDGTLRLLFVSPERCVQAAFLKTLATCPVRLIAIDEAHCISAWGHNFRPEYRQLAQLRKIFPDVPLIALTATATPEVRKDIVQQLGLLRAKEFVGSFNRTNLQYRVTEKKNPLVFLSNYIGQHRTQAGIIYCLSRNEAGEIALGLKKKGFRAAAYHAGLPPSARVAVQDAFLKGDVDVVCATVAFGMGIDKPDVRFVIHASLPRTLEAYYQETGRAGRDCQYSECILLYSKGDAARLRSFISHDSLSGTNLKIALAKLQAMTDFCETTGCRRHNLLRYFGEAYPADNCGSCDTCSSPPDMADCTAAARLVAGCVQAMPGRFGTELIIDVLRGSKGEKVRQYGLDGLAVYGTGKKYSKGQYRTWIAELVRQGFLERSGDQYPVIGLTGKGRELLNGRLRAMLPAPETGPVKDADVPADTGLNNDARDLFLRLKDLRKEIAGKQGVQPYMIFPDRSLKEMAASRPGDREGLLAITGVGPFKLARYGPVFLEAIRAG
ncbi:MAG: DNA helicase RecQ [Methanoregula sp.]|jgi:ATP-dependent DNA helicase RecQ|nr:DNA helicase RecQ [Methanoregula sp.]